MAKTLTPVLLFQNAHVRVVHTYSLQSSVKPDRLVFEGHGTKDAMGQPTWTAAKHIDAKTGVFADRTVYEAFVGMAQEVTDLILVAKKHKATK
jgi:hypothetical protein